MSHSGSLGELPRITLEPEDVTVMPSCGNGLNIERPNLPTDGAADLLLLLRRSGGHLLKDEEREASSFVIVVSCWVSRECGNETTPWDDMY